MTIVIIRILLRYLAAALVTRGFMSQDMTDMFSNDPDFASGLEVVLGSVFAAIAEYSYYLAHKLGWRK